MAAATITKAQAELISSLSQDEIPIKLRCAICSKLAVNAFRLPCCEQAICETCHSTLPSSCPVCEHTPVAAADCKPNKSLRTTIKVFLRTEEKKREASRSKDESPPETPVETAATPIEVTAPIKELVKEERDLTDNVAEVNGSSLRVEDSLSAPKPIEDPQDVPQQSIEEISPGQESIGDADAVKPEEAEDSNRGEEESKDTAEDQGISQTSGFGAGFGFDPSATSAYPNMPFGGDFSQMQMMMAMQNGMNPAAFGNFPMMGMPGMNMDPMTMQNMFMNGGFGAGMNGMNMGMGMGMGGFDGGVGTGFNNGWNGQQSWNVGPDNFNHPNASSMGQGDYGANNSSYNSHAAGYNQGNYGRPNQFNDYANNNYGSQGFRGRGGRGRGGYSRGGGYGQNFNEPFSHQLPQQFGVQPNGATSDSSYIPTGPKADNANSTVDEFGREIRQKADIKEGTPSKTADENAVQEPGTTIAEDGQAAEVNPGDQKGANGPTDGANLTMPIQTLDDMSAQYGQSSGNNAYGGRGFYQGGTGRGHFPSMQHPFVKSAADVPINAPTGPKAMREGLPNTSLSNLYSRGYPVPFGSAPKVSTNASASVPPEPSEKASRERNKSRTRSPERDRDEDLERERSRSRSRSREKSRDRKRSRSRERHRSSRHRDKSHTPTEDDQETERRRERRREQRRRREEEREARDTKVDDNDEKKDDGKSEEIVEERSRTASPSESRRSSHRSRREKDKYREREKDSDREYKSSSHRRRSHRERSRSRDRDRERDREREHRHERHSRRHSTDEAERPSTSSKTKNDDPAYESTTPIEGEFSSRKPPIAPSTSNGLNGIEIKGASIRHKSTIDEVKIPTGPRGDRTSTSQSTRDREKSSRGHEHRSSHSRHESSRHESSRSARDKDREREHEALKSTSTVGSAKDPHELEREARNRERLLKEAQRIAGLTAGLGRKRSRDDGDAGEQSSVSKSGSGRGRKKGRRGGGAGDENEEARIARLEAEREGARWG